MTYKMLKDLPSSQLLVVIVKSADGSSSTIRCFTGIDAMLHALKAEDLKVCKIAEVPVEFSQAELEKQLKDFLVKDYVR